MTWQELRGQLVVGSVAILTTFVAYTSQIFVLWNFLGGATLSTLFILIPFNVCVVMIYINYSLVCLTDPGTVPGNWMPDPKDICIEVKRSTHAPRYCKTCNNYKPPRTHHCSSCNRCVLKMDHHCPWINNCVGFANYGHFIRFIVYVLVSSIYLFTLLSCRLAQIISDMNSHNVLPSNVEAAFLSINLILAAAAIVTVGILSGYHVYCLTTNTTTIEGWEKGTALTFKSLDKITSVRYPYNLGLFRNICAVLGSQPIFWFWPQRMRGDGLQFPVRKQDGSWQEIIDDEEEEEEEELEEEMQEVQDGDEHSVIDDHHHHHGNKKKNSQRRRIHSNNSSYHGYANIDDVDDDDDDEHYDDDEEKAIGRGRRHHRHHKSIQEEISTLVISAPPRVHTRASTSSFNPTTPASVMTFASSSTLVDHTAKFPTCSKETFEMSHR
ncbi:DHHC palmitoyltransferase-domain-containing protein [Zychaea mexicana]|uniref:DHHC palmitoyltransferase-domain-containing protein n=1 Tax=Zychaea mexicana TaxID=64656 RepID=UPI0022FF2208|nr:DHHC palmitoyltransferase-domain-containing protein [Zychaea mexicana]KAI9491473.1 DHHC palmitoyltransferase-domain-containing protein [Zychaea mexicana]